ncbi:XrtA-associated tyrosine autokinase [Pseudoduganella sp. OTU4001]|uniref:XrtA-associated tyrosine autokinase n=1 Tax=Pseudoduganella sp. OTU4001 TaxID=3043854 RepID=UPI00313B9DAE
MKLPPSLLEVAPPGETGFADINLVRMRQRGMITHESGRTSVAEDFRIIKRHLLKDARASGTSAIPHGNLIVVTSALPGEGKTYCAINLAMSISMERDARALLVDADVARPSVLKVLGLQAERGLMDVLLDGSVELSDVIMRTNVPSLTLLPAGPASRHATELLASRNMTRLLEELANRYPDRIIIFDSPPLLLTTESSVLVSQMGQVVVVVEAETTTQAAVRDALARIEHCPNLNLIYNKSRAFPGSDYYGYYE